MLRPSVAFAFLSALFAFDTAPASACSPETVHTVQTICEPLEELNEDQRIALEARRQIGRELSGR